MYKSIPVYELAPCPLGAAAAFKWSTEQAFMLGDSLKPTFPCVIHTTWHSIEGFVCCSIVRIIDLDDLGFLNKGPSDEVIHTQREGSVGRVAHSIEYRCEGL